MAIVDAILRKLVTAGGSHAHVAVGAPITIRKHGNLIALSAGPLSAGHTAVMLDELLSPEQRQRFQEDLELELTYEAPGLGRFRCSALHQERGIDVCFKAIPSQLPESAARGLPPALKAACRAHQGLVLITGPAGSGKSTTLACLVDDLNASRMLQIVTIEDPVEFVHPAKQSAVVQREVGRHTATFAGALRAALREDPDVISVGELRDPETISLAITAAETGHLVLGSMNTTSSRRTIDRLIEAFPLRQQAQTRILLADSLRAVFTQRLLVRRDGAGVVLAHELLLASTQLSALIRDGKTFQVPNLLQTGKTQGLRSMDESLLELLDHNVVTAAEALPHAENLALFERFLGQSAQLLFGDQTGVGGR